MALESMIFPLPSELVMPFAGFLVADGKMNFWLVALLSTIGTLLGSLISYFIGYRGGHRFVDKYGKYFLVDKHDLKITERYFKKSGEKTILISRFIPVVRHLISIPAGIGKMDLKKFSLYTVIGGGIWNIFLAWLGFLLGENWKEVKYYAEYISIPVAIILVIVCVYFVYRHVKNKRNMRKI
ncbi:MAG: DedA family protein [Candidatus Woesearchaeota archaeon]